MQTARSAGSEFVLTFAVVLVGAGAAITGGFGLDATGIALAYGLITAAAIGSGAGAPAAAGAAGAAGQANPAITIALWVSGRVATGRAIASVLAQIAGAIAAGLLLRYVNPGAAFVAASGGTPAVASGTAAGKAIVIEATATFVLVFVYAATIASVRGGRTRTGALLTGIAVVALAMVFSPYTGAAMNPARWLGPALASGTWANWEVWLVGPIAGAIIGAVAHTVLVARDDALDGS
jgi:glycerol uptake facilitator-like aquaporin